MSRRFSEEPTSVNTSRPCPPLGWRAVLEQVQAGRFGDGFLATMDVQFVVETADLRLDRIG